MKLINVSNTQNHMDNTDLVLSCNAPFQIPVFNQMPNVQMIKDLLKFLDQAQIFEIF